MSTNVARKKEIRAVLALGAIFSFRMLGLFMIMPVFALYSDKIKNATPTSMGIALGIYGLTQAFFQIPFGMLSDKIGRKQVITIGLSIFAIGSIFAALSHSIFGIIIGRALQGAGAIGSTINAYVADITRVENRTKAMAVIGGVIGLSFVIAMITGPFLNSFIHLSGLFWVTAFLATLGIVILYTLIPRPLQTNNLTAQPQNRLLTQLRNPELLGLNIGIFTLHAILTGSFVVLPNIIEKLVSHQETQQWRFYLPIFLMSILTMLPFIRMSEKPQHTKKFLLTTVTLIAISQFILSNGYHSLFIVEVGLYLFFTNFTLLEALLPSLVSKIAPAESKGTAMGIYSSSQFLGIFIGGSLAGLIYAHLNLTSVFLFCDILALFWLYSIAYLKVGNKLVMDRAEKKSAKDMSNV